jgi:DNA (cytosine-5)-methyltransferase 1
MRPRLLDLYCGIGGSARGYHDAGFDIVGVDIVRQYEYPYTFIRGDAVAFLRSHDLTDYDVVHASPPCKLHTVARRVTTARYVTLFEPHVDFIEETRDLLVDAGIPYVIENVVGAPLLHAVRYCGSSFGLQVRRHRLFESSLPLVAPPCRHDLQPNPVGVYGDGGAWVRVAPGGGGRKVVGKDAADAMGIDWTTTQHGLAQAVPPAYTEHIGRQLIAQLVGVPT